MTLNEASNKDKCPKCSTKLSFNYLNGGGWKVGFCSNCWAMPIFCVNCQIWTLIRYTSDDDTYNWNCRQCGSDDINYITCCSK